MANNFLKEVIANTTNKVNLVIINQKQFKTSIDYLLEKLLLEQKNEIILVSFSQPGKEILNKFNSPKLHIIDAFSEEEENEKIIYLKAGNLTKLQIEIDELMKEKSIVIFDSLGVLGLYNSAQDVGKFVYFFSNKIKLNNNSCIFVVVKESIDEETLNFAKQFCDRTYNFSELFVSIEETT